MKEKIEDKTEGIGRRERIHERLLDDNKETRSSWKLKRKHQIALCGELALEETVDLS